MQPEEIKKLRQRLGLTQEQMAYRLGVTLMTVSRWERGTMEPSPLARQRLETLRTEADHEAIAS